jgi:hypothetical protein
MTTRFIEAFDYDTYSQWKLTRNEPEDESSKVDTKKPSVSLSESTVSTGKWLEI